jgi:hypothetical protein
VPGDPPPATAVNHATGSPRRAPLHLVAGSTRVEFSWAGDRWRHVVTPPSAGPDRIGPADPPQRPTQWHSVEASITPPADPPQRPTQWHSVEASITPPADPRRPASPVITELSLLGPAGAPTAILGVGHAGLGHCSLAVTIDADDPDAVRFHVACRLSAAWPGLGSTYRHAEGWTTVVAGADQPPPPASPHTVVWTYRIGPAGLAVIEGATLRSGASPRPGAGGWGGD